MPTPRPCCAAKPSSGRGRYSTATTALALRRRRRRHSDRHARAVGSQINRLDQSHANTWSPNAAPGSAPEPAHGPRRAVNHFTLCVERSPTRSVPRMSDGRMSFPTTASGEWWGFDVSTPLGKLTARCTEAQGILELPDFIAPGLTLEDRQRLLRLHAANYLTVRAIVDTVVALEDFVRELGRALSLSLFLKGTFPRIHELAPMQVTRSAPGGRTEKDPFALLDPARTAAAYHDVFGVRLFDGVELPRLRDLVLLRHCVSHHGPTIRPQDADRFLYYAVPAGQRLTPTWEFAQAEVAWIYSVGSAVNRAVAVQVYLSLVPEAPRLPIRATPADVADLLRITSHLGLLPESNEPVPLGVQRRAIDLLEEERELRSRKD